MKQNAKSPREDDRLTPRLVLVAALGAVLFLSPTVISVSGRFPVALGMFAGWALVISLVVLVVRRAR